MAQHIRIESPGVSEDEEVVILDDAEADFLNAQGIEVATAVAFGCARVDDAVRSSFGLIGRRQPAGVGISIPTVDPRDADRILGLVRLSAGQNKHRFATDPPAGIAIAEGFATAPRVVLVDHPLLAFRLYQSGVAGVALVESPVVLPPLLDALQTRPLIIAAHRAAGVADLRAGLGLLGSAARSIQIPPMLDRLGAAGRALLGLPVVALPEARPRPPITPVCLGRLMEYGWRCTESAEGQDALRGLGFDHPDIRAAYRPAYLPADVRAVLSDEDRAACAEVRLGNAVLLPAYDADGAVVDLVVILCCAGGSVRATLYDAPRGMLAPVLATCSEQLVGTDGAGRIARLWTTDAPALYLRGPADALSNAARLAAGGVRSMTVSAHVQAQAMADALAAAGIAVEVVTDPTDRRTGHGRIVAMTAPAAPAEDAPAAPEMFAQATEPALTLLRYDERLRRATFASGPAVWTVDLPRGTGTTMEVEVAHAGQAHRCRLDLALPVQRTRFIAPAAAKVGLLAADIAVTLHRLLPEVQRVAAPPTAETPTEPPRDPEATRALLADPALLDRLASDLNLGLDSAIAALVVLVAASRWTADPIWLAITVGDPSASNPILPALVAITPPAGLVHATRLTDGVLMAQPTDGLRHRQIVADDGPSISPGAIAFLAVLRSTGSFTTTATVRSAQRGEITTVSRSVRGPVALVTAGNVPAPLKHHVVELPIDGAASAWGGLTDEVCARFHDVLGAITPRPVRLPTDADAGLPTAVARQGLLRRTYRALIAASALLHQQHRRTDAGQVEAAPEDVAQATRCLAPLIAATDAAALGIGRTAHRMLLVMRATPGSPASFTLETLGALLPGWCRWSLRNAVEGLVEADLATATRAGRGGRKTYTLTTTDAEVAGGWRVPPATSIPGVRYA